MRARGERRRPPPSWPSWQSGSRPPRTSTTRGAVLHGARRYGCPRQATPTARSPSSSRRLKALLPGPSARQCSRASPARWRASTTCAVRSSSIARGARGGRGRRGPRGARSTSASPASCRSRGTPQRPHARGAGRRGCVRVPGMTSSAARRWRASGFCISAAGEASPARRWRRRLRSSGPCRRARARRSNGRPRVPARLVGRARARPATARGPAREP